MSTQAPGLVRSEPPLPRVPRIDDLPVATQGYEREKVQEAFDAFRKLLTWYQAEPRVPQSAPRAAAADVTGHTLRMDALHLIRQAADFADALERDAQDAAARQLGRTGAEIREGNAKLDQREGEVDRYKKDVEREAAEILSSTRKEAQELLAKAKRDAGHELAEGRAPGGARPPAAPAAPPLVPPADPALEPAGGPEPAADEGQPAAEDVGPA